MKSISEFMPKVERGKSRATERGELMRFFQKHLNYSRKIDGHGPLSMPRLGRILEGIPTKDLYYLKSVCSKAKNFGKKFWWEVDPKKHTAEAKASSPF
jgi:hypothetical protein